MKVEDSKMVAVFDIDGTLVDTNYQHAISWYRAFRARPAVERTSLPRVLTCARCSR
jgi:beta-phosphoglucomutase-like phosphatase (HAD superfamily)